MLATRICEVRHIPPSNPPTLLRRSVCIAMHEVVRVSVQAIRTIIETQPNARGANDDIYNASYLMNQIRRVALRVPNLMM